MSKSGPFDWSPFQPVADALSKHLTFATSKGMEQFGCCPKTAGNSSRRVLFGWINNGWDQGQLHWCASYVYFILLDKLTLIHVDTRIMYCTGWVDQQRMGSRLGGLKRAPHRTKPHRTIHTCVCTRNTRLRVTICCCNQTWHPVQC